MNTDERAIRELVDTWMSASIAGDVATVLDLMTDDVLFTVVGQEPFGKEEFAAAAEAPHAAGSPAPGTRTRSPSARPARPTPPIRS